MPRAPRRPCTFAGCAELVEGGRCRTHQGSAANPSRDRKSKEHVAFYTGARWRKLRRSFLARHPLCVDCDARGQVEPATEVDHIEPRAKRPDLQYDPRNLRGLCKRCHSRRTASSRRG